MGTHLGEKVGHIRLKERLATGGMGSVYVGFDEKLQREVAVKAIRNDRVDDVTRARFLREARLLSQLDHPNVCRVHEYIEGDLSDYLVLELISGRTLRQAMADGISRRLRFRIAEQTAQALAAAHAEGVIHRDLKPGNVMLVPDGRVKVLDFGIARSFDPPPASGERRAGERKPRAASAAGGTEADSSLSVADYTWVAGRAPGKSPSRIARGSWHGGAGPRRSAEGGGSRGAGGEATDYVETERGSVLGTPAYMSPEQARGEPVTAASDLYSLGLILQELFTGLSAYERGLPYHVLLAKAASGDTRPLDGEGGSALDADLAQLVRSLKSLDPMARPSALEVAGWLRRLRHKPVRRRRQLLASAATALLLSAGVKYTWDLRRERSAAVVARADAEQARQESEQVTELLVGLFQGVDPAEARGDTVTVREVLDDATERISRELEQQPRVRGRLTDALGMIYLHLGLYQPAHRLLASALADTESVFGADSAEVADSLVHLATALEHQARHVEAEPLLERALDIRTRVGGAGQPGVGEVLRMLGGLDRVRGKLSHAETRLRQALEIQESALGSDHEEVATTVYALALVYDARGELERAEPLLERAMAIRERILGADHPSVLTAVNALANLHTDRGDLTRAEPLYRRALEMGERILGEDHPSFTSFLNNLAFLYRQRGEAAQAEPLYTRALEIRRRNRGAEHPRVAIVLHNLADLYSRHGDDARAEPLFLRALPILEQSRGADHLSVASTLQLLARLYRHRGDHGRAEPLYRRALEIRESKLGADHHLVGSSLTELAALRLAQGDADGAEALLRRAVDIGQRRLAANPDRSTDRHRLAKAYLGLGSVSLRLGAADAARDSWSRARELVGPLIERYEVIVYRATYALALLHLGRTDEAWPIVEELVAKRWGDPELIELCRKHGWTARKRDPLT